jgi:hypothetical protein
MDVNGCHNLILIPSLPLVCINVMNGTLGINTGQITQMPEREFSIHSIPLPLIVLATIMWGLLPFAGRLSKKVNQRSQIMPINLMDLPIKGLRHLSASGSICIVSSVMPSKAHAVAVNNADQVA